MAPISTPKSVLEVPVIDVGPLIALQDDASVAAVLREDNTELQLIISAVRAAATEWGFFYVENHGLSEKHLAQLQTVMRAFFALPKEAKNTVRRTSTNSRGYYDSELTKNKLDWKEVFDFAGRHGDPSSQADANKGVHNQWLDEAALPGFRGTVQDHFDKMEHISRRLIQVFAVALGERVDFFDQFFYQAGDQADTKAAKISDNTSAMRLNYYPIAPEPEKTMGVYNHTDFGALTVLLQDDEVASLQVFHRGAQQWTHVPPRKNTFVINIGDLMQVWSNDKFIAPEHRVLASSVGDRFSVPFFYLPSLKAEVQPIVVRDGEKPHYRVIHWGKFLRSAVDGNYADLGTEDINIRHFKIEQASA